MKKPRSDSVLYKLPPHQRAQLMAWLRENHSYRAISRMLGEKFSVKISEAGVRGFYARNLELLQPYELAPSVGISVTVTPGGRVGELVLAFDAPPLESGEATENLLATIPATVRSAGFRVVAMQDGAESRVRLVAYPISPDEEARPSSSASPDVQKGEDRP